ncbi:MAG: signal peptidase I [Candidatus Gracilibacteria bacterium]|nr:signal peptidase I [Candidatus Gracilibacteria bacterium]
MNFKEKYKEMFSKEKEDKDLLNSQEPEKKLTMKEEAIDFLKDLVVILFIVILIRTFIMVPFQISGSSMSDSFYDREYIIVDKFSYLKLPFFGSMSNPTRGDVVVFRPGVSQDKEFFIKRIVGVPGDTLKIEKGEVYIKKSGNEEFIKLDETYLNGNNKGYTYVSGDAEEKLYVVPEDSYFVMGDNRGHSTDSRECFYSCVVHKTNFIKRADIEGLVLMDLGYFDLWKFGFKNENDQSTSPKFFNIPRQHEYPELSK